MSNDFAWLDATAQAALVRRGEATGNEVIEAEDAAPWAHRTLSLQ